MRHTQKCCCLVFRNIHYTAVGKFFFSEGNPLAGYIRERTPSLVLYLPPSQLQGHIRIQSTHSTTTTRTTTMMTTTTKTATTRTPVTGGATFSGKKTAEGGSKGAHAETHTQLRFTQRCHYITERSHMLTKQQLCWWLQEVTAYLCLCLGRLGRW